MTSFAQMAGVLATREAPRPARDLSNLKSAFVTGTGCCEARRNGNTDKIRAMLQRGPATAREIANACDLKGSGFVGALLRHDVQKGKVFLSDGLYSWNYDYDDQEEEELRDAVKLLKKHGFKVQQP